MATIKSFTSIDQSKKLAEILPLESADGFWKYHDKWCSEGDEWEGYEDYPRAEPYLEYTRKENEWKEDKSDIPCWSLAALLVVLPRFIEFKGDKYYLRFMKEYVEYANDEVSITGRCLHTTGNDNLVDACVEMIIKLHEFEML